MFPVSSVLTLLSLRHPKLVNHLEVFSFKLTLKTPFSMLSTYRFCFFDPVLFSQSPISSFSATFALPATSVFPSWSSSTPIKLIFSFCSYIIFTCRQFLLSIVVPLVSALDTNSSSLVSAPLTTVISLTLLFKPMSGTG